MENQNWEPVIFNKINTKKKEQVHVQEETKMQAPTKIGQIISQSRCTKGMTQKQLATNLGIAISVLSRWETEKETPSNADIAKIEKTLAIKLPRSKKIKIID